MRILVCGSRHWKNYTLINNFLATLPKDTILVSGGAPGADTMAEIAARENGLEIEVYPALWHIHKKGAGPIRNKQMLDEGRPDRVFGFHSNIAKSKGTKNMIMQAEKAGVPTVVIDYRGHYNMSLWD